MNWWKKLFGGVNKDNWSCAKCGRSLHVPRLPRTVTCPDCQSQWGTKVEGSMDGFVDKVAMCLKCGGSLLPFDNVDMLQKNWDEIEDKTNMKDPAKSGTIWRSRWIWVKCIECGDTSKVPVSKPRS